MIDSHAHLGDTKLWEDCEQIIRRAKAVGITKILNICTDLQTLERGQSLAKREPLILNSAALSPHDVQKDPNFFEYVAKNARENALIAIGETGLDYYYLHSSKEAQKAFFIHHLHLALETALPIIIHCRDAFADVFQILDQEYLQNKKNQGGVFHCFTGSLEEAKEILKRGFSISLSGIITFKNSTSLRETIKIIPENKLLLETDAPYLAPQSKRGLLNEPSYLPEISEVLATLKNKSSIEMAKSTAQNFQKLFGIN